MKEKGSKLRPQDPRRWEGFLFLTVHEAQKWVEKYRTEAAGVICPCCEQLVKVYRRPLNASMALVLLELAKVARRQGQDREYIHVPSFINTLPFSPEVKAAIRGDWAKLKFWGFISPAGAEREDGSKRTGYYLVTDDGIKFAEGRMRAPAAVYITNQTVLGRDKKQIGIEDALGEKFNYAEIMGAAAPPA